MSGFSFSLKSAYNGSKGKQGKNSSKQKRTNLFQDGSGNDTAKRTKLMLTHVDEKTINSDPTKLVIKPIASSSYKGTGQRQLEATTQVDPQKYGLNVTQGSSNKEPISKWPSTLFNKGNHNTTEINSGTLAEITKEEEYEEVPVEEFGAALLRGMGWIAEDEDLEPSNSKLKKHSQLLPHTKERPENMGIGSKFPNNFVPSKRSVGEDLYMPVIKIDKHTGEKIE